MQTTNAPSFHLDDENLDPRTWCRFPILSGGFAVELNLLREQVFPTIPAQAGFPKSISA